MPNCPPKKNKKNAFFLLTVLSFALKWARPKGRFTMKAKDIIEKLNGGKIRTVTMKKLLPIKKTVVKAGNHPGIIEKKTVMQVRGGVEYEKLASVRAAARRWRARSSPSGAAHASTPPSERT